jgi:tRNA (adenine37-N6)-methyltransferase
VIRHNFIYVNKSIPGLSHLIEDEGLKFVPIGIVKDRKDDLKEVIIHDVFSNGLTGVDKCEHLWILYWMNRLSDEERDILLAHPQGKRLKKKQGIFSLHSPMRPNPIGMTRVKLIKRMGNELVVEGLDAFGGTPVLDIKSG